MDHSSPATGNRQAPVQPTNFDAGRDDERDPVDTLDVDASDARAKKRALRDGLATSWTAGASVLSRTHRTNLINRRLPWKKCRHRCRNASRTASSAIVFARRLLPTSCTAAGITPRPGISSRCLTVLRCVRSVPISCRGALHITPTFAVNAPRSVLPAQHSAKRMSIRMAR